MPAGKQEPLMRPSVGDEEMVISGLGQLSATVGSAQVVMAQASKVVAAILLGQLVIVG